VQVYEGGGADDGGRDALTLVVALLASGIAIAAGAVSILGRRKAVT
jgi:hypothetical protein